MTVSDFTIKQGNRLPRITSILRDSAEAVIDLTTATGVALRYRREGSSTVITKTATIVSAADGSVAYDWEADDTADAGLLFAEWEITFPGGLTYSVPNNTNFTIEVAPSVGTVEDAETLISIGELKALYLFGVDLTDDAGTPFPDSMYKHYIDAAVAWLEKELDIPLTAVDVVAETQDHYAREYGRWGWFQLDKYPVISVSEVVFQYPSMLEGVEIDSSWIVLEDGGASGQLQIVPGQGNIADVLLIPGALMPLWSGATGRVPGVWRFSYRAGFEVGALPADLKHAIGMQAAIGVFNIAGDLIAGAGIANLSISVPGLNQNVGTTSSATNSGYGARIGEYQKELKEMLPNLRRYYGKGTRLTVA